MGGDVDFGIALFEQKARMKEGRGALNNAYLTQPT